MTSILLPDHHIVRWVRKRHLLRDANHDVIGITPEALALRDNEDYLSVNWLEYFDSNYEEGFTKGVAAIRQGLNIKKNDGFSVTTVGDFRRICSEHGENVEIIHSPEALNPGHVSIRGFPRNNEDLLNALSDTIFFDTRLNSSIP